MKYSKLLLMRNKKFRGNFQSDPSKLFEGNVSKKHTERKSNHFHCLEQIYSIKLMD